jgi:hypothetical protein
MKPPIFLLLLPFAFASITYSQSLPEWQDPEVVQVNREAPHATLFSFESMEAAMEGEMHNSSNFLSLNGPWKFHWSPDPGSRPVDFYRPGFRDRDWDVIQVPSNWEIMGYGYPIYVNIPYEWTTDPRPGGILQEKLCAPGPLEGQGGNHPFRSGQIGLLPVGKR